MRRSLLAAATVATSLLLLAARPAVTAPVAERRPTTETLHGVVVSDDYRWLEAAGTPEVEAWVDGQDRWAHTKLDRLPDAPALREEVRRLLTGTSASWSGLTEAGGTVFALENRPPKQQPTLVALPPTLDPAAARVVVDPNRIDPTGRTTIDWFVPSPDGTRVALSLSSGGSESGDLHVYEVATGQERPGDTIPRVHGGTAGGSAAWSADGTGLWYTRYPRPDERSGAEAGFWQQLWYHPLGGNPAQDRRVLGDGLPRIAEIEVHTEGDRLLVDVSNGDGGEHAFWLGDRAGLTKVAPFAARVVRGTLGPDGATYLLSRAGASRGRVLRLAPGVTDLDQATVVVPEGEGAIAGMIASATKLWVVDVVGGPSRLRVFPSTGGPGVDVPQPPIAAVGGLVALGGDTIAFRAVTYTQPPAWIRTDGGAPMPTPLVVTSPADFSDVEVSRDFATSKDGTRVPVNLIRRKGTPLDGNNRVLLTGYGGYGVSRSPSFDPVARAWLDRGGVIAIANLRGGGEYGDDWHLAGNLTHKQNVFDDFIAVAEHLIAQGWTRPARLGIQGGSNGGLLMGAVVTQRPELFGAVVSRAGIYDMLHVEDDTNGAFNVTEFGTVKDPAQFAALYAYSPYHHVREGTRYPPMLFTTGRNDPRVWPYHSRKMVARLQAVGAPAILRTSSFGHGIGNSLDQDVSDRSEAYAFLLAALGG